ncbi:MAG: tRNA (adenosine(37)-N6)-dimethylallyltransferase MiaA [Candidatus Colwellbacteria bacterium]|nr:tRNA (adenosine(37)-N6)-dimethylallyltransferase MiaA [Candidatus Colwellbacteria bacterium]
MSVKKIPKIIVVLGPTASGKSDLAVELALKNNGEIISADSRQVYRGLDIGSGKVTDEEMRGINHYLLDVVSPKEIFSASDYAKLARRAVDNIISRGKLPIVCGGTGFYIDALLYEDSVAPIPPNPEIRKKIDKLPTEDLAKMLSGLDPDRFASIDTHNRVRLIRALEIVLSTGKPVPKLEKKLRYDAKKIGIMWPLSILDERIEIRLDQRLKDGMTDEVERLHKKGLSWKRLYDLGLEYRYISLYLRGKISYDEMRNQLLTAIRQYARRQMTWFKRDKEIKWIRK